MDPVVSVIYPLACCFITADELVLAIESSSHQPGWRYTRHPATQCYFTGLAANGLDRWEGDDG